MLISWKGIIITTQHLPLSLIHYFQEIYLYKIFITWNLYHTLLPVVTKARVKLWLGQKVNRINLGTNLVFIMRGQKGTNPFDYQSCIDRVYEIKIIVYNSILPWQQQESMILQLLNASKWNNNRRNTCAHISCFYAFVF